MEEDFWRRRLGLWDATASEIFNQFLVGGFNHLLFSIIDGMPSFPLTNSIMFQDGDIAPPTRYMTPWEIVGIMASWGTTKGYRLVAMGLENLSTEHEDVEQEKVELS